MLSETKHAAPILHIKSLSKSGEIEGYASTFGGEPDSYGDVIAPGAFAESIAAHIASGTAPKMFWQHDRNEVIGKWTEFSEDAKGLAVKGQISTRVQRGAEAVALLEDGALDGLSIGYNVKRYEFDTEKEIWTLLEIDLKEISVVSIPANPNSTITSLKAARAVEGLKEKLAAGDRLSTREFETLLKGSFGLSNSQAERAAALHLKAQGDPAEADEALRFLQALAV